eukprot:1207411-Pleurochrysis_carterae.AAC.1
MKNRARIHMKVWNGKKNEHKAKVQQRWDNRGNMHKTFVRWKTALGYEDTDEEIRKGKEEEEAKLKKTYGMKH